MTVVYPSSLSHAIDRSPPDPPLEFRPVLLVPNSPSGANHAERTRKCLKEEQGYCCSLERRFCHLVEGKIKLVELHSVEVSSHQFSSKTSSACSILCFVSQPLKLLLTPPKTS